MGIERDNHKEIENCQNQKKDEEIKVVDYSQFEASTKSGIHADVNRIRQKDEIIRAVVKKRRNSAITCVCFVCMAGISLLKGWIPALICILIALFFLWRAVGKFSDEYLRELYEEGLLVPGMIVKTEPLTIMAIANMVAQEGAAAVNGCYCLEVKELDGAKKELFEKIPCSCFFCYEGGKYHSSFQPHPLYWGTMDQQEIGEALRQVEEDNRENSKDEWEVLKEIAQKFPDLGNGNMILLDENYVPFGKKNYIKKYRRLLLLRHFIGAFIVLFVLLAVCLGIESVGNNNFYIFIEKVAGYDFACFVHDYEPFGKKNYMDSNYQALNQQGEVV